MVLQLPSVVSFTCPGAHEMVHLQVTGTSLVMKHPRCGNVDPGVLQLQLLLNTSQVSGCAVQFL